jgi:hypothetical protein
MSAEITEIMCCLSEQDSSFRFKKLLVLDLFACQRVRTIWMILPSKSSGRPGCRIGHGRLCLAYRSIRGSCYC